MTRRIIPQADLNAIWRQSFDIHKIVDPLNRGFNNMVNAEENHLQAPFKAITNYDDYVDPQQHQWNPASANDPDDSASYNDQVNQFNEFGTDHEERARARRKKELGDIGRDAVEGITYPALGFTGSKTYPTTKTGMSSQARYLLLPHWDPEECRNIMNDHHVDMLYNEHHQASVHTALPQPTPELMNQAKAGGFTLHDHVGDGPTSGYMVSLNKNTEHAMPMNQLTPKLVGDYVQKNASHLQDPNSYLGGWLDKGNFYLDVSHHVPDLYHATKSALGAKQLGIYDLNHGRTIDTDEAGWMTGNPQVVGSRDGRVPLATQERRGGSGRHLAQEGGPASVDGRGFEHLPEHDWTQHGLGTDEDWGIQRLGVAPTLPAPPVAPAPPATPAPEALPSPPTEPPPWTELTNSGQTVGSHGGQIWNHAPTGQNWLVKPAPPGKDFLADADVAANHIAARSGVTTPATFKTQMPNGQTASMQQMFPAKDAFPGHKVGNLSPEDTLTLQKHHALDWMLGNHDSHPGQYIRNHQGTLIGIDKAQAFKYSNQDKLNWSTHMNEHQPIHNKMWHDFATGGNTQLADPRQPGPLNDYVKGLQAMPDADLVQTLTPYAMGASKAGELGKQFSHQHLHPSIKFQPNSVPGFIHHMTQRKNSLMDDLGNLYDKAMAHRMTGTKVAANPEKLPVSLLMGVRNRVSSAKFVRLSTINVTLKYKDGTPGDKGSAILPRDARSLADQLAGKHGLTLKEMSRSPDTAGALPMYLPAYRNNDYVGNVAIERAEQENFDPYGPNKNQYVYSRTATPALPTLPGMPAAHPPQMPTLPKLPTPGLPTPTGAPKLPQPGGEEAQQLTPLPGPATRPGPSNLWKSEHAQGQPDDFANDLQQSEAIHHIDPATGKPGAGGSPGMSAPAGGTPGMGTTPTSGGSPVSYTPSAGVDQWQSQIEEGLRRNGLPVTPEYVNKVKTQVKSESSGDPNAINKTDSNAIAGHPSQGLLQTIPSTFQQYHLPGDSNSITDPQANIDSAVGYAKSRYGPGLMDSQGNGMGSGRGY